MQRSLPNGVKKWHEKKKAANKTVSPIAPFITLLTPEAFFAVSDAFRGARCSDDSVRAAVAAYADVLTS